MYKAFFGLRAKPFRLNPDPRFFHASRGARRALDFLRFGLYQREGIVLLTGATGVGKTLLLRSLAAHLPGDATALAQVQPLGGNSEDLLRQIVSAFGAPLSGNDVCPLAVLHRHLVAQAEARRRSLLFVDEAQNLDCQGLETLRMLSNLQVGAASAVQIFLIARAGIRQPLAGAGFESLRQRVIAADHLDPLDMDEVGPYIAWRMNRAGWTAGSPFDDAAIAAIAAATAAVPRRINTLCDRLLMQAFVNDRKTIGGSDVPRVVDEMQAEWAPALAGPPLPGHDRAVRDHPVIPELTDLAEPTAAAPRAAARHAAATTVPPARAMPSAAIPVGPAVAADEADERFATLESRMAALEASTAQVAKISRAILGRMDAGNPV